MTKENKNAPQNPEQWITTGETVKAKPAEISAVNRMISGQVNKALEGDDMAELDKIVFEVVDNVDDSKPMKKLREYWKHVPQMVRWAILHVPGTVPEPFIQVCRNLMFCGFLPYHEDPAMNKEYMRHKDSYDKTFIKWALKIGKYFVPELVAVEQSMKPIYPIIDKYNDYRRRIREHLIDRRGSDGESGSGGGGSGGESGESGGESGESGKGTKYISVDTDLTDEDLPKPGRTYGGRGRVGEQGSKYISPDTDLSDEDVPRPGRTYGVRGVKGAAEEKPPQKGRITKYISDSE